MNGIHRSDESILNYQGLSSDPGQSSRRILTLRLEPIYTRHLSRGHASSIPASLIRRRLETCAFTLTARHGRRGEAIYCAENENNFASLTVGDTLRFAAESRCVSPKSLLKHLERWSADEQGLN